MKIQFNQKSLSRRYQGLAALAATVLWLASAAPVVAGSPPFSDNFVYQGRLEQSGVPADGSYDFRFELYRGAGSTNSASGPAFVDGVEVTEGVFTAGVPLGFAIDGTELWLEVAVKQPADPDYTVLTPRHRLQATPHAVYAAALDHPIVAGEVDDNAIQLRVGGSCPSDEAIRVIGADGTVICQPAGGSKWNGVAGDAIHHDGKVGIGILPTADLHVDGSEVILPGLRLEKQTGSTDTVHVLGGSVHNSVTGNVNGATVAGGGSSAAPNEAAGSFSTVGGGMGNTAGQELELSATVGGGRNNTATGGSSTIAGGAANTATNAVTTVGGGSGNSALNLGAVVSGGIDNSASGSTSAVGGGRDNIASGIFTTVSGGRENKAGNDQGATVGGGRNNIAQGNEATIGGGRDNMTGASQATVGGGLNNEASANYATVSGGLNNTASFGFYTTIGGGQENTANAANATIGGGKSNVASGGQSTIGGGDSNTAGGGNSTIGGGVGNTTGSLYSTVPGGLFNTADGLYSFAAGRQAKANHHGTFVWADSTNADFASSDVNQFMVRATGGVGFGEAPSDYFVINTPFGTQDTDYSFGTGALRVRIGGATRFRVLGNGGVAIGSSYQVSGVPERGMRVSGVVELASLGAAGSEDLCRNTISGAISPCSSSRRYKEEIATLDSVLDLVEQLRPVSYRWIDTGMPDLGLVAEEVAAVEPRLVTFNGDGEIEGVRYRQLAAVLVGALQEQQSRLHQVDEELAQLRRELAQLRHAFERTGW